MSFERGFGGLKGRSHRFVAEWRLLAVRGRTRVVLGTTINISTTGALFTSPMPLKAGQTVGVEIEGANFTLYQCDCQVVRVLHGEAGHVYGIRFLNLDHQDRRRLLATLQRSAWKSLERHPRTETPARVGSTVPSLALIQQASSRP